MQHARNPQLCWLAQENLNFLQMTQVICVACCVRWMLHRLCCCVLQVAKTEPVTTVECAICTQNHPGRYPLVAGTRHSSREGVFASDGVVINLLCLTEMWTIFGLGSFAAYKKSYPDLSCKFQLPQLTISKTVQKYLCMNL